MSNHSEHLVENVIIALLTARAGLTGVSIVHSDSDSDAATNRIVVKATQGNRLLAGPGGHRYDVEATIKGAKLTATTWETWRREVELGLHNTPNPIPAGVTAALSGIFTDFYELPDPDREDNRETSPDMHQSTVKIAIQAVEA